MTGTDPAIEAARRAFDRWRFARPKKNAEVLTETAAREALAPVRALHKRHRDLEWDGEWSDPYCRTCAHERWGDLCLQPWPCDTARLIYTSEELNHD